MDTKDFIKLGVLFCLYFALAPLAGWLVSRWRPGQKLLFIVLCFMTLGGFTQPEEWGLTLANEPDYRGHSRGFHFYFAEAVAMALIVSAMFDPRTRFRIAPPGVLLWLFYCAMSFVSIVNAPHVHYVFMAALKALKLLLILVAAFNFIREEKDVAFALKTLTGVMLWEMLVVVKLKYLDGYHQVSGTFEHQNSLAMYACLVGMVLLAAALGPRPPGARTRWLTPQNLYLVGYIASGIIVQATLSRGGLAAFAVGTAGVLFFSLIDRISRRKVMVLGALCVVGMIGLAFTADSIIARFKDRYTIDSNETRARLNKASAAMLKEKPLGVGWNLYAVVINPPYRYGDVIDEWFVIHGERVDRHEKKGISESLYWLLLAETGYPGFAAFMLFIGAFLWRNARGALHFRRHFVGCVSLVIAMGCLGNYAQSLLERVLTQPRNAMLWMILLAMAARIELWRRAERKRKRTPRPAALSDEITAPELPPRRRAAAYG